MACNVTVVQLEIKKIRAFFDFNDGECKSREVSEFMTLQLALLSRIKFCLHIAIWPGFACDELGTPIAASSIRFHTSNSNVHTRPHGQTAHTRAKIGDGYCTTKFFTGMAIRKAGCRAEAVGNFFPIFPPGATPD